MRGAGDAQARPGRWGQPPPAHAGWWCGAGCSAPVPAPALAHRRLLRLPEPPDGDSDACRRRAGRSASPSLRQFQELALCCEDAGNESMSASELDRRSTASTAVPLESVDSFVQSASELAVEALKLGRTAEAQRIIRLADSLYEQRGVGGAAAKRWGRNPDAAAAPAPERPPSRTRLASTFRELATLVSDGEDCSVPSRPMSHAEQYSQRSQRSQRPAHAETSLWSADPLSSSGAAPCSAFAAAARPGFASELAAPPPGACHSGARRPLAPLDPVSAPPVVNVYGTAYFGSGPGGAGTPLGTGRTASRPGTVRGADASSTELALKAQYILEMQGSRTSSARQQHWTTLSKSSGHEDCLERRDFQQTIVHKDAAASAPASSATLASHASDMDLGGEQARGKHAHAVKLEPLRAAHAQIASAANETDLKPSSAVHTAAGEFDVKVPVAMEAGSVGGDAARQRRGEMTLQSLEDTWGLKKLIKMAASRRESSCSSPDHDTTAEMDNFVHVSMAAHEFGELSGSKMCASLDQSGAANPNYNPRPDSVDLGMLPNFPAHSMGLVDSMCGDAASSLSTSAHEETVDDFTTGRVGHERPPSPDASTSLDTSSSEDDDDVTLSLGEDSLTERSSGSNFSHLSHERTYVDNSYQHQRLIDTFNGRRQRLCTLIQRAVRMSLARRRLQAERYEVARAREQSLHSAALTIQYMFFSAQQRALDRKARAAARRQPDRREKAGMILTGFARLVLTCKAVRQQERQRGLGQFFAGLTSIFGEANAPFNAAGAIADTRAAPCIQIQCCVRSWLAKRAVRPELQQRRVWRAATTLQQSFRTHAAQKEFCALKYARVVERRVRMLQAAWRMHSARAHLTRERVARREGKAAATIQRACLMRAARNAARNLRQLPLRRAAEAALLLQHQAAAARRIQQVARGHAARTYASHLRDVLRRDELEFCQHLVACRRRIALAVTGADDASERKGIEDQDASGMTSSSELRRAIFSSAETALARARLSVAVSSLDESMSHCPEPAETAGCAGTSVSASSNAFDLSLSPVLGTTSLPQHLPALPALIGEKLKPLQVLASQSLDREGNQAAAALQAVWRGHVARNTARRRLRFLAVVRLQRVYRGHQGRAERKRVATSVSAAAAAHTAAAAAAVAKRPPTAFQDLRTKAAAVCVQRTGRPPAFVCADANPASDAPKKSWAAALSVRNVSDDDAGAGVPWSQLEEEAPLLGCASSVGSPAKSPERRVFQSSSQALMRVRP